MTYRDDLEAAQHHIRDLEEKLAQAEAEKQALLAPKRAANRRGLLVVAGMLVAGVAVGALAFVGFRFRGTEAIRAPIPVAAERGDPMPVASEHRGITPESPKPNWGRGACKVVVPCYVQSHYSGRVDGLLSVAIGKDGSTGAATYSGSASLAVRKCLVEATKASSLSGYEGPGGKLVCKYQGEVFGGSSQMFTSSDFIEPDAGP